MENFNVFRTQLLDKLIWQNPTIPCHY